MLRAALKAGIIMGIVLAVFDVILNVINASFPDLPPPPQYEWVVTGGNVLCLLMPVLWFVSGILASRFGAAAALTTRATAGAGALAGAITQVVVRIVDVVMNLIMLALGVVIIPFSPGTIQRLAQLGLRPDEIHTFAYMTVPFADEAAVDRLSACMVCGGLSVAIAAGLGGLGGILGRAISVRRRS